MKVERRGRRRSWGGHDCRRDHNRPPGRGGSQHARGAVINVITADQQVQIAAIGLEVSVCRREDSVCAVTIVVPDAVIVCDGTTITIRLPGTEPPAA